MFDLVLLTTAESGYNTNLEMYSSKVVCKITLLMLFDICTLDLVKLQKKTCSKVSCLTGKFAQNV